MPAESDSDCRSERDIRAELAHTWIPFFSRFGRLTEVQVRAIPRVLAGDNLVVISPAASGKTEAALAPAIERLLPARRGRFSILYVAPTRALVNDIFRRLQEPLARLELGLARKTGDHPTLEERRLPFLLITTPESFDSLLCRHPRIFRELSAVILDELHLLDNTPRGDQLRALMGRLRLINGNAQCCAMSATIDDEGIGGRYFPDPVVVKVAGRRDIEYVLLPMNEDWPRRAAAELVRRECRKSLCFFNARSSAEGAVRLFDEPPFAGRVWVHHASLTRATREASEELMNREQTGILCCTSTLELGIDIGDVDAVVLVRPPFNVSSLLQRIGRGNRRRQSGLFAVGFYQGAWERLLFETFFDCARQGRLYEKRYTPALSVLPQQLASYAFQRRRIGMTLESARRLLAPLAGNAETVERVFRQLVSDGVLQSGRAGIYTLGAALERQVESGRIHSNIQEKSFGAYEVHDVTSGRQVGTVFFALEHFVLAGRAWQMVELRQKEKRLMVRPERSVAPSTKVFEGTGTGGYSYRLAPVLKQRLFPGLGPGQFPYFVDGDDVHVVHLLGCSYGALLADALAAGGTGATDMDGKLLVLPGAGGELDVFPVPERDAVRAVVMRNLTRFEDNLGSGAFFRLLPVELQVEDHLLAFDVDGLFEFLAGIEPVRMTAEAVNEQIAGHLAGSRLTEVS
jgi:ATP-dependent Lhr-like helicase